MTSCTIDYVMAASPELKQQEAVSQAQQLWEHFVVVGLPNTGLQTVHGEPGFLGTDQKYKPAFVDSLPHSNFDEACRLPPQLPTVSFSSEDSGAEPSACLP